MILILVLVLPAGGRGENNPELVILRATLGGLLGLNVVVQIGCCT